MEENPIEVGKLFPDKEDRKLLCLEVALEHGANVQSDRKIIPYQIIENTTSSLVLRGSMQLPLESLDRELRRVKNGAKIHSVPNLRQIAGGYYEMIKTNQIPDCPVENAIIYPAHFAAIVKAFSKAQYFFGIRM